MSMAVVAQFRQAAIGLRAARQRTLLALLGIVVGIASVIALLTTGAMAKAEAARQFESLGADMLSLFDVTPRSARRSARSILVASDAGKLARLATIARASPYTVNSMALDLAGHNVLTVHLVGVTPAFADMHDARVASGRFISPLDGRRPFAVVGADVARAIRESGGAREVGTRLRLGGRIYTVIGTLPEGVSGPPAVRAKSAVFVPIDIAERVRGTREINGITLRLAPGVHYLTATADVVEQFARAARAMEVRVDSPVPVIEHMEAQMRLFTLLLGALGGISLVVGGFGVMNAMLASVAERRVEIGVRRALGARQGDIRAQFLAESSLLCGAGGVLGAVLGVGVTVAISALADWTWVLSPLAISLGAATAIAVGVFFGYFPAQQAARLDPIAAMRDA